MQNFAGLSWGVEQPFVGDVMVTITYLYNRGSIDIDVDNIPKPILDALKGLVYSDDSQVTDLLCRKRPSDGDLGIDNFSTLFRATQELSEEFVHVNVDDALNREVEA